MYNGNGIVAGGVAGTGGVLAATGSSSAWMALAAVVLIVGGFAIARHAGRRTS